MNIEQDMPLSKATSLHVGGTADYFIRVHTDHEVAEALQFSHQQNVPFFILGQGSNTLFPDSGYRGVVLHMEDRSLALSGTTVTAASGVFMRQLVTYCLEHELQGLEELAGIPGTVGGAVRGNAGTWQTEIKDLVQYVEIMEYQATTGVVTKKKLSAEKCAFGYRDSIFKTQRSWIILRTTFGLHPGSGAAGQKLVAQDLTERHQRQPYDAPSAGSIFKNPNKAQGVYAGALIEQCGLKGTRRGGAEISEKHANFILNRGHAKSTEILELIMLARQAVQAKFDILLTPEIEIIPPLPSHTDNDKNSLDKAAH